MNNNKAMTSTEVVTISKEEKTTGVTADETMEAILEADTVIINHLLLPYKASLISWVVCFQ